MNFKSKGLFIAILILIAMLAICHISNYIYSKQYKNKNKINNSFSNLPLSMLIVPVDTKYNKITYEKQIDPSKCENINEAEIPCSIISSCSSVTKTTVPITTQYELSESEWAVVYKAAYEAAGLEVLSRTLDEKKPKTTNPNPTQKQTGQYWP